MKKRIYILSILLLCSCAHRVTDDEILLMSDKDLCQMVQNNKNDLRLIEFMNGRNLACHPIQITCRKSGNKVGSEGFKKCVRNLTYQEAIEKQEAQRSAQAIGNGLKQWGQDMQNNRPITTNCYGSYGSRTCTTY